jgi:hypothetical protein
MNADNWCSRDGNKYDKRGTSNIDDAKADAWPKTNRLNRSEKQKSLNTKCIYTILSACLLPVIMAGCCSPLVPRTWRSLRWFHIWSHKLPISLIPTDFMIHNFTASSNPIQSTAHSNLGMCVEMTTKKFRRSESPGTMPALQPPWALASAFQFHDHFYSR